MSTVDTMIERFQMYNPFTNKTITNFKQLSQYELLVEFSDESKIVWNERLCAIVPKLSINKTMSDDEWKLAFAKKLNYIMTSESVSQKQMADAIGVTQSTVSRYMSGKAIPNYRVLQRIAFYLDRDIDEFKYCEYFR